MSVSASMDLKINTESITFILDVIRLLLAFGWRFNYDGAVFYLPVGDDDDFNWHSDDISDDELLDILREKERLGELIGVAMTWKNTGIGGEFLFRQDGSFSVNLSINRRKVKEGFTDATWYFSRIIPALAVGKINIESIEFSEHV